MILTASGRSRWFRYGGRLTNPVHQWPDPEVYTHYPSGIKLRLEPSPKNLRGMSHRELGDHTSTLALLLETANPIMDRLHGRTSERLILDGKDEFFLRAARNGLLYVPYGDGGLPIEERAGRHLSALQAFSRIFGELHPGREIGLEGVPDHAALLSKGVGAFLRDPGA